MAAQCAVLWLSSANETAMRNLLCEAEARGIDAARLIFAKRLDRMEDHLARHRLADLFLDTLPYMAHSTPPPTALDWPASVDLPGRDFASRVASSLLKATDLQELVTDNLADYEALAFKLATDPVMLSDMKAKLERNRITSPLFDSARLRATSRPPARLCGRHSRAARLRRVSLSGRNDLTIWILPR